MTKEFREEINSVIEGFVNSIYDNGEKSGWTKATFEQWLEAVYNELVNYRNIDGYSYQSNSNRFKGKENLINSIIPLLKKRLQGLKKEGYNLKSL